MWIFPIQNQLKLPITEQRENKAKYVTRNSVCLWRGLACQNLLKVNQVAPDLLKTLAIPPDKTARRSAIDWEDLRLYWREKKATFSKVINKAIHKFFKDYEQQKED